MVEFGKQLKSTIRKGRKDWSSFYIHYDRLKDLLKPKHQEQEDQPNQEQRRQFQHQRSRSFSNVFTSFREERQLQDQQPVVTTSTVFRQALDQEIEKVVLFLLRQQGHLAESLATLNAQRESCQQQVASLQSLCSPFSHSDHNSNNGDDDNDDRLDRIQKLLEETLGPLCQEYRAAAQLILEFIAYVETNVTAVRKILKKHDKHHAALSEAYIRRFVAEDEDTHLNQLYYYGGLSALLVTMQKAFEELHTMEVDLLLLMEAVRLEQADNKANHRRIQSEPPTAAMFVSSMDVEQQQLADDSSAIVFHPNMNHPSQQRHRRQHQLRIQMEDECTLTSRKEPLLAKIYAARSRLKQSTKYVEVVAAQALMFGDDDEGSLLGEEPKDMTRAQRISSFLNLCSTFLYMTNYYIVAPTSGDYADKLGSTQAMAGIIIGMTPNAALIATVLYGWWSNYSYKSALIFAAGCSFSGNLFYALALHQNSLTFVMIGRFLNGFGSARSINRRFIADTFSRNERTAASAAFVTAGALGMAVGPAIAAVLGRCQFPLDSRFWTVETSPGWVMMTLWFCYFLSAIFLFEEPDRTGLYGTPKPSSDNKVVVENSERQPLLLHKSSNVSTAASSLGEKKVTPPQPLYKNVPVMMTLWIYFVLKLALECLLSSSATVTKLYFSWNAQHTGTFLAFLGLLMFPANMVVARLSHRYEDRELLYVTLIIMLFSVLGILVYTPDHYSALQYVFFGICVFLSANCLEGPNMSLLSKTIPRSWAKGTFNSGFLATEAGTLARSVGDVMISAAAAIMGFENVLNTTFLPLMACILLSIVLFRHFFESMIEDDDDDDTAEETIQSRTQSFEDAMSEQLKEIE
eukprot:scaffold12118_cov138-Cylindrotheca_fusiformis.AAC.9